MQQKFLLKNIAFCLAIFLLASCSQNKGQISASNDKSPSSKKSLDITPSPTLPSWKNAELVGNITYGEGGTIDTGSITKIEFSPNGKLLASKVGSNRIRLWDLGSGNRLFTLNCLGKDAPEKQSYWIRIKGCYGRGRFGDFLFTKDGKYIVGWKVGSIVASNNVLFQANIESIKPELSSLNESNISVLLASNGFKTGSGLAITSDKKIMVSGDFYNKEITAWDLLKKNKLYSTISLQIGQRSNALTRNYSGLVNEMVISKDDTMFAVAATNNPIRVFDIKTGEEIISSSSNPNNAFNTVIFTPDNKAVIAGNRRGQIKTWSLENGTLINTFTGHQAAVNSIAISSDGQFILSGSSDKSMKLWDSKTGRNLNTFNIGQTVNTVAFTPDDRFIAAGDDSGSIRIWRKK